MEKISLLAATRKRPKGLLDMWNSFIDKATDKNNIELILAIDDDDNETIEAIKYFPYNNKIKLIIAPRTKYLSSLWNKCFDICVGDIIVPCSDDCLMRTDKWDTLIENIFIKYDDKIIIIHPNDGINGESLCTIPIFYRSWIEVVGYVLPPYFVADMADTWIHEVSSAINRRIYTPSLYIEHMHFGQGKSKYDEVYAERRAMGISENVCGLYNDLKEERQSDISKLLNFINNFKKDKI